MSLGTPMTPEMLLAPSNGWALLAAVSLGALVGLVRQWNEGERPPAGLRTFALWSALGFVAAQLERAGVAHAFLALLAVFGALVVALAVRPSGAGDSPGPTTLSAGLLVFLAGALLGFGFARYAVVVAIIVAGLIGILGLTTTWSAKLNETDVRAGLQFAFLSGVILPLVPDETLWGVLNPYDTWRMVVLISGVNFCGYVAMRLLGDRSGAALTGLLGGLVSSTAVTLAFARRSREDPGNGAAHAQPVLLACFVMVPRVLALLFLLSPEFAISLLPAGIAVGLASLIVPMRLYLGGSHGTKETAPAVSNPLQPGTAVRFALLYALIVFIVGHAHDFAGKAGLFAVGFVSGLTDVDAISLSLARGVGEGVHENDLAATTVLIAFAANTLTKLLLSVSIGRGEFRRHVAIGLGATLACVLVAIALRW